MTATSVAPVMRPAPVLLAAALVLAGCSGDDEPTAAPTTAAPATSAPTTKAACDYLRDEDVSDLLGGSVEGVPTGPELCSWGELALSVLTATPAEFDEERDINAADSDTTPPPLGFGEDSYLILGDPGGTASAGVYRNGRKGVLALPGDVPQEQQKTILTTFAGQVAGQL